MEYIIDKMTDDDGEQVCSIFLECTASNTPIAQPQAFDWGEWNFFHLQDCRLIAKAGNNLIGWAALSQLLFQHIAPDIAVVSVYVRPGYQKQGIGTALLSTLVKTSEQCEIFTLQALILKGNTSSIALHDRCGFNEVDQNKEITPITFCQQAAFSSGMVLMERQSRIRGW